MPSHGADFEDSKTQQRSHSLSHVQSLSARVPAPPCHAARSAPAAGCRASSRHGHRRGEALGRPSPRPCRRDAATRPQTGDPSCSGPSLLRSMIFFSSVLAFPSFLTFLLLPFSSSFFLFFFFFFLRPCALKPRHAPSTSSSGCAVSATRFRPREGKVSGERRQAGNHGPGPEGEEVLEQQRASSLLSAGKSRAMHVQWCMQTGRHSSRSLSQEVTIVNSKRYWQRRGPSLRPSAARGRFRPRPCDARGQSATFGPVVNKIKKEKRKRKRERKGKRKNPLAPGTAQNKPPVVYACSKAEKSPSRWTFSSDLPLTSGSSLDCRSREQSTNKRACKSWLPCNSGRPVALRRVYLYIHAYTATWRST